MEMLFNMTALKRVAAMGLLLVVPLLAKGQKSDSTAINDLLKESEEHARLATNDAETLESYSRSEVSWQTHGNRLMAIKDHANELIDDFNRLSTMRAEASAWQEEAIDRVNPLLHEMADHLQATVNHFKQNKDKVKMPAFKDYVQQNAKYMNRASQLISDFVEYGETRARADSLEKNLELPTTVSENE